MTRSGSGAPVERAAGVRREPSRRAEPASWLELAVEVDIEAVEAVSEILGRFAPGGSSVEPAFELVDEGLGARVDPTRPAIIRAYLPAADAATARRTVDEVETALGHLQAFGLRPIGELRTRPVVEADWADAWKAYFPVMRVGRRLVIRPTWRRHRAAPDDVVLALDPGMAFGTGLHPTTRLCLAAIEKAADDGARARAPASSMSAAGRGSCRSPRCDSVPHRRSGWTRIRSRSTPRSRTPGATA